MRGEAGYMGVYRVYSITRVIKGKQVIWGFTGYTVYTRVIKGTQDI